MGCLADPLGRGGAELLLADLAGQPLLAQDGDAGAVVLGPHLFAGLAAKMHVEQDHLAQEGRVLRRGDGLAGILRCAAAARRPGQPARRPGSGRRRHRQHGREPWALPPRPADDRS